MEFCFTRLRMRTAKISSTLGDLRATRIRQSRHKLVIIIASLWGKEHELVEKAKRCSRMSLASLWQSVVVQTLLNWAMGGNSSTPALIHQSSLLRRWHTKVFPNWSWDVGSPSAEKQCWWMDHTRRKSVYVEVEVIGPLPVGYRTVRRRLIGDEPFWWCWSQIFYTKKVCFWNTSQVWL